jgi:hypothetical protein
MQKENILANCALTDDRYRGICKLLNLGDDPAEVNGDNLKTLEKIALWFSAGQVKSLKEAKARLDEEANKAIAASASHSQLGDVQQVVDTVTSAAEQAAEDVMYEVIPGDIQKRNAQVRALAAQAHQDRIIAIATDPDYAQKLRPVMEDDLPSFLPEYHQTALPPGQA